MSFLHSHILDAYFWHFVDGGIEPEQTPLFSGLLDGTPLVDVVSRQFRISPLDAEDAIELARQEVAL